jgi:hypothetical protein
MEKECGIGDSYLVYKNDHCVHLITEPNGYLWLPLSQSNESDTVIAAGPFGLQHFAP